MSKRKINMAKKYSGIQDNFIFEMELHKLPVFITDGMSGAHLGYVIAEIQKREIVAYESGRLYERLDNATKHDEQESQAPNERDRLSI